MQIIKRLFLSNMQVFFLPIKSYRWLFESVYKLMDDAPLTASFRRKSQRGKELKRLNCFTTQTRTNPVRASLAVAVDATVTDVHAPCVARRVLGT